MQVGNGDREVRLPVGQEGGQGHATDEVFGQLEAIAPGEGFRVKSTGR